MLSTIASDVLSGMLIRKSGCSEVFKAFGLLPLEPTSTTHLWFLRSLFLAVLVSPMLIRGIKRFRTAFIVLLVCFNFALPFFPGIFGVWVRGFFGVSLSIHGVIYFAIGAWLRLSGFALKSRKMATGALVVGVCMLVYSGSLINYSVPFLLFAFWEFMPNGVWPNWLTRASFPVYLMHYAVISYWLVLSKNLGIATGFRNVLAWPIAFIGSVLAAVMISRLMPRIGVVLFGGRCP